MLSGTVCVHGFSFIDTGRASAIRGFNYVKETTYSVILLMNILCCETDKNNSMANNNIVYLNILLNNLTVFLFNVIGFLVCPQSNFTEYQCSYKQNYAFKLTIVF